jgi:branched-subunit amino acid transport protein
MNAATVTLVALALGTYGLKAAGPFLLAGRPDLPPWLTRLSTLAPVALLAALAAVGTLTSEKDVTVDARLAGVVAAGVALWLKAPFVVVVVAAALATAATRAIAG